MEEKIYDILERVELQQKAIWWDNLMLFCTVCFIFLFAFAKNIFNVRNILLMLILIIAIQYFEEIEKRRIRKFYKNAGRKKV